MRTTGKTESAGAAISLPAAQEERVIPEHLKGLEWVSVTEAAELIGVHFNAIYQAVYKGKLTTEKRHGKKMLRSAAVLEYGENLGPKAGRKLKG